MDVMLENYDLFDFDISFNYNYTIHNNSGVFVIQTFHYHVKIQKSFFMNQSVFCKNI